MVKSTETKKEIREKYREIREDLPGEMRKDADARIAERKLGRATLLKPSQGQELPVFNGQEVRRAWLTNVQLFLDLVFDDEAWCDRDNLAQVVLLCSDCL